MHIEGSSISCGVRRLIIGKDEKVSKEKLVELIKGNSGQCAMVVAGVPTRCKDVTTLLLDNKFEPVKDPHKKVKVKPVDISICSDFHELAASLMYHESDEPDDLVLSEQFVEATINADIADMATLIMHHGNELTGKLDFFVYFM